MTGRIASHPQAMTVLIVEDDEPTAELWADHLEQSSLITARILTATRLADAERIISLQRVNCVLLDLGLPDSDRLDTLAEFVAREPTVPIVVITGNATVTGLRAVELGAQDFLHKADVTLTTLERSVLYAVERHRAHRELTAANRELDQFADVVAHDLRAPLTAAEGHLRLLFERHSDELSGPVRELLDHVRTSQVRMRQLLEDTLTYARVRHDRLAVSKIDLNRIARRIPDALRLDDPSRITFNELPTILGDPNLLERLLANLVDNGLRYVDDDEATVAIRADRQGDGWRICVDDSGTGIRPELRDRAFDPYRRLPGSAGHPGTGLGLAIARQIVDRHNGAIWIEDSAAGGTSVCFTLPDDTTDDDYSAHEGAELPSDRDEDAETSDGTAGSDDRHEGLG